MTANVRRLVLNTMRNGGAPGHLLYSHDIDDSTK